MYMDRLYTETISLLGLCATLWALRRCRTGIVLCGNGAKHVRTSSAVTLAIFSCVLLCGAEG